MRLGVNPSHGAGPLTLSTVEGSSGGSPALPNRRTRPTPPSVIPPAESQSKMLQAERPPREDASLACAEPESIPVGRPAGRPGVGFSPLSHPL